MGLQWDFAHLLTGAGFPPSTVCFTRCFTGRTGLDGPSPKGPLATAHQDELGRVANADALATFDAVF